MSQRRLTMVTVTAATAAVVVAGCANKTAGLPQAEGNVTADTSGSTPSSAKSTTPNASKVDVDDPCSLMSSAEASSLGYHDGTTKMVLDKYKVCNWRGAAGGEGLAMGHAKYSLAYLNGQNADIGTKHKAATLPPVPYIGSGGCTIGLEMSDSTTLVIIGTPSGGQPDDVACPKVNQVAKILDPKLP